MSKLKPTTFIRGKYKGRNDIYAKFWDKELNGEEPLKIKGFTFLFRFMGDGKTIDGRPLQQGTDYYQKD